MLRHAAASLSYRCLAAANWGKANSGGNPHTGTADAQVQTADPGPQHGPTNQPRYLPCDLFSWPLQEVSKGAQPMTSGVLQGVDWERYARGEGSLKTEPQRHFPVGSETKKRPGYSSYPKTL